jgi:Na+/melibiose symporter-like transporter
MANPLGNAAGSVIPTLIVSAPSDMPALMLYQAIWATAINILVVIAVRDRPPTPPSAAAALKLHHTSPRHKGSLQAAGLSPNTAALLSDNIVEESSDSAIGGTVTDHVHDNAAAALKRLKADFGLLFRNTNFLRLMTAFGIGLGIFNAILTLLAQYIAPCHYDDNLAGIAGGALLGAGLLGAFVVGVILEKTRAYMLVLKCGIIAAISATIFNLCSMQQDAPVQLVASFAVMGLALIPLLPVSLENAAECTYPVPEDNSAALLLQAGQIVGIIMIFALTPMINLNPQADCSSVVTPSAGLILGLMVVAVAVLLPFKKDYRRQAAELARKRDLDSEESTPTVLLQT